MMDSTPAREVNSSIVIPGFWVARLKFIAIEQHMRWDSASRYIRCCARLLVYLQEVRAGSRCGDLHRLAVSAQRSDVVVRLSGAYPPTLPAPLEELIHERADILVLATTLAPEAPEFAKGPTGRLEGSPYPMRRRVLILGVNSEEAFIIVRHHRIEKLRMFHRKEQETEGMISEASQRLRRIPDGVGKSHDREFIQRNQWQRSKDRVTEPRGFRLDRVIEADGPLGGAVVSNDVQLAGRNHKADLVHARQEHAVYQVLTDGARPLRITA